MAVYSPAFEKEPSTQARLVMPFTSGCWPPTCAAGTATQTSEVTAVSRQHRLSQTSPIPELPLWCPTKACAGCRLCLS